MKKKAELRTNPQKLYSLLLAGATLLTNLSCSSDQPTPPHRDLSTLNVILCTVDTLRADHVGASGYERPTTPTIDRLASEGVQFSQAYSASSYTRESISSFSQGYTSYAGAKLDAVCLQCRYFGDAIRGDRLRDSIIQQQQYDFGGEFLTWIRSHCLPAES